jgi:hypothetical protein
VGCKIEIKEKSKPASSSPRTLLINTVSREHETENELIQKIRSLV